MRPLILSLGVCLGALGVAWAQNTGSGSMQQLPVGQTFKHFEFPMYENGQLKYTGSATEATGITLNRAEATKLKIEIYENGAVTTTITSPKADLYVAEQKMRTKNTVLIERADEVATAQTCDFDLKAKKYLLRTNVRVVMKNFDTRPASAKNGATSSAPGTVPPRPTILTTPARGLGPISPSATHNNDSLLDSPGAYSDTNSAPNPPPNPDPK